MEPGLRRGAIISAALHITVILLLLIGLPMLRPMHEPEETAIAMVFDGGTAETSMKAPTPAAVPAPAAAPQVTQAPQAEQPPKPQPIEAAPPPPPPPPAPPPPPQE